MNAYLVVNGTAIDAKLNLSPESADALKESGWFVTAENVIWAGPNAKMIVNDKLVERPQIPLAPTPELSLDDLKQQAIWRTKEIRDRMEMSGFTFRGKLFDSDMKSAQRINFAATIAETALRSGIAYDINWTVADNTDIALDAAGVIGMAAALATLSGDLHQTARGIKALIMAASTPAEILVASTWPE